VGDVRVVSDKGQTQRAIRGSPLSSGDTVVTGKRALAQLSMVDNGRISLRANTEFKLDEYKFKKDEPTVGRIFVNLLRGSFRSLTGLIGRNNRSGYRVRTPHATLGVRGTDHETTVLLAPRDGFSPGTFDVVFEGRTVMSTERGQIEISPRQAGFVGATTPVPTIIKIPRFLRAVPNAQATVRRAGARARAAAKPAADSRDGAKPINRKSMLLNPITNPKAKAKVSTLRRKSVGSKTRSVKGSRTSVRAIAPSALPTTKRSTTLSPVLRTPLTTISPKLTAPLTIISPKLTAPITTISPRLTAPITTINPKLTAPTTTISPKLTTPTR
jgi:hypothetical protein